MSEPSSILEVYQLHVWLCEISPLIWRRLPWDRKRIYPVCMGGKRAAPPEDCGVPWAFMALHDEHSPGYFLDRYADLLESIRAGDLDEARDQLAELEPLQAWLALEHFDRRQVNRRLKSFALGDEVWRWE
jgi:hypothetical protein